MPQPPSLSHGVAVFAHEDRNPWLRNGERVTLAEATTWSDIVALAIKGTAVESVVKDLASVLAGKIVIDATNPIADEKPDNGVLRYFTGPNESLMERLQTAAPAARFVKAFNSVGNAVFWRSSFEIEGTMFIAGNDAATKDEVTKILDGFGWNAMDLGGAAAARPIEALCQLWCIPGFLNNDWTHGFAYLPRKQ